MMWYMGCRVPAENAAIQLKHTGRLNISVWKNNLKNSLDLTDRELATTKIINIKQNYRFYNAGLA